LEQRSRVSRGADDGLAALFNRFPLLYPDSMTYLADGPLVARALFLRQFSEYYGIRRSSTASSFCRCTGT